MSPDPTDVPDEATCSARPTCDPAPAGESAGVVTLDADGVVTGWDGEAERLLGYGPDEVRGERLPAILPGEATSLGDGRDALEVASETGRYRGTQRLVRRDGTTVTAEVTVAAVPNDGSPCGFAAFVREHATGAVRDAEVERYGALLEAVEDAACVVDPDGRVAAVNGALTDLTGDGREELLGTQVSTLLSERFDGPDRADGGAMPDGLGGEPDGTTVRLRTGDDGSESVEVECERLPLGDRRPGAVAVFREATEDGWTDKQFESIAEHLSEVVAVVDRDGTIRRVWPSTDRALGYDPGELVGESGLDYVHPDDRPAVRGALDALDGGGDEEGDREGDGSRVERVEYRFRSADGRWLWFESAMSGRTVGEGGYLVTSREVTERKRRERELAEEREFIETALDTLADIFYVVTPTGEFVRWNDELPAATGYSADEVRRMNALEFFEGDDVERIRDFFESVMETGEATVEADLVTKDGTAVPYASRGRRLVDPEGNTVGICGISRDISGRKERERELARFERAVDASGHAIFMTDTDGRIEYTNSAFEEITGYTEAEALGRTPSILKSGRHEEPFYRDLWETVLDGEVWDGELANRRKSGEVYYAEQTVAPVTEDTGAVDRLVAVQRDVTTRRKQEHELVRRHEELETLNRIHRLVEDVIRELTAQSSRDDIEETVRDSLLESERYTTVSVLDLPPGLFVGPGDDVDEGVLESVGAALEPLVPDLDPETVRRGVLLDVLREGTVRVVQRVEGSPRLPAAAREGLLEQGVESLAVIPFGHGENRYGAILVGAEHPDRFRERERAAFGALAEAVGLATYAVRNERLLLADTVVELTFHAADAEACLARLAVELGCECTLEGVVPGSDGSLVLFARVAGAEPDAVDGTVADIGNITSHRVHPEGDAECTLEASVCPDCLLGRLDRAGATVRTLRTAPDGADLVVEAAPDDSLREVSRAVRRRSSTWRLAGKRTVDRPPRTERPLRETIEERLTDKQYNVLRAAHLAGYFEFPRGSTAEEVAGTLGISDATFHQHLRAATRKLVTRLFETTDATPAGGESSRA